MKKYNNLLTKGFAFVCGLSLMIGLSQKAEAVGTASGTSVDNIAIVNYQVGGVAQDDIASSPGGNSDPTSAGAVTTFVVDNKVDLTVSTVDVAAVPVAPGAAAQVLTFTVDNTGNTTQDYALTALQLAGGTGNFGGTDTFDMTGVSIFVEDGTTSGYQVGEDTATFIDELAPSTLTPLVDNSVTVYIVSDVPLSQVDDDIASFHLRATTHDAGAAGLGIQTAATAGADTAAAVDVVLADGIGSDTTNDTQYDGEHSSQDDYIVATAVLTVQKTSAVTSDPFNGATNPKRIPGATIQYTITVSNDAGASSSADSVVITDAIPSDVTYTAGTITLGGSPQTDIVDGDGSDFNVSNAGAITVTIPSVAAGASSVVTFDVTVN